MKSAAELTALSRKIGKLSLMIYDPGRNEGMNYVTKSADAPDLRHSRAKGPGGCQLRITAF